MRTHHVTVGARSSLFDLPQAKLPSGPAVMLVLRKAAGESTSTVRKKGREVDHGNHQDGW